MDKTMTENEIEYNRFIGLLLNELVSYINTNDKKKPYLSISVKNVTNNDEFRCIWTIVGVFCNIFKTDVRLSNMNFIQRLKFKWVLARNEYYFPNVKKNKNKNKNDETINIYDFIETEYKKFHNKNKLKENELKNYMTEIYISFYKGEFYE